MTELELTPEEVKNGWTKESLQAYFDSREREQAKHIHGKKIRKPNVQQSKYNPHRWRG